MQKRQITRKMNKMSSGISCHLKLQRSSQSSCGVSLCEAFTLYSIWCIRVGLNNCLPMSLRGRLQTGTTRNRAGLDGAIHVGR